MLHPSTRLIQIEYKSCLVNIAMMSYNYSHLHHPVKLLMGPKRDRDQYVEDPPDASDFGSLRETKL